MTLALEGLLREIDRSIRRPEGSVHPHGDFLRRRVVQLGSRTSSNIEIVSIKRGVRLEGAWCPFRRSTATFTLACLFNLVTVVG